MCWALGIDWCAEGGLCGPRGASEVPGNCQSPLNFLLVSDIPMVCLLQQEPQHSLAPDKKERHLYQVFSLLISWKVDCKARIEILYTEKGTSFSCF